MPRLLTHSAGTTVSGFPGYASTAAVPTTIRRAVSAEYDWPDFKPVQRTTAPIDASKLRGPR